MPRLPQAGESAGLGALTTFVRTASGADLVLAFEADDTGFATPLAADPPPLPDVFGLPEHGFDRLDWTDSPRPAEGLHLPSAVLLALGRPAERVLFVPTPVPGAPRSGVLLLWAANGARTCICPFRDEIGHAPGLLRQVFGQMLASRREALHRRLNLGLFRDVFDSVPAGIVLIDGGGNNNLVNRRAAELLDLPAGRVEIAQIAARMTALRRACTNAEALEALYAPHQADPNYALVTLWQWGERWLEVDTHPVSGDGRLGRVWLFEDVTQRQHQAADLERAAHFDALTGLVNRHRFHALAAPLLQQAAREGHDLSLLMLDLDHFKAVNDRYGHAAGDRVLRATADRMRAALRARDIAARLGGEEFAALLPGTAPADARLIAERLRAAIAAAPVEVGDAAIAVTVSIGLAGARPGETELAAVLARADEALYAAKRAGRDRVAAAG
ncbi:GGDEF domain-containing protein [Zavarzinia compransoris]|uniref:GGDEF domain-containing protein n=1 Tax=Zavarzinia compransoris TaxID=1264899 RepID=A0A317E4J2_9PROT|nr:GGDEF domain-containing protein [Zavarzinia compransoris]